MSNPEDLNFDPMEAEFTSHNAVDIVMEGVLESASKPIPPSLLAWLEYERARMNPTQSTSMPRPGTLLPEAQSQ